MKLPYVPWKQAWHDQEISEKFYQELAKLEKGVVPELESSARWMEQLVVELGQLAQNMIQLETTDPHAPQVRLAFDRAIKLAALAAHLAAALHQVQAGRGEAQPSAPPAGLARAVEAAAAQAKGLAPDGRPAAAGYAPMRRTIHSLAERGVSISEIEVITGHPRHVIEAILAER
jgi:hypothetical protein